MKTYKRFALDYFFCDRIEAGLQGIVIPSKVKTWITSFLLYDRPNAEADVAPFLEIFMNEARARFCSKLYAPASIPSTSEINAETWGVLLPTERTESNIPDSIADNEFMRVFKAFFTRYGQLPSAFAAFRKANKFDGNGQEIARNTTTNTSGTNTNTSEDLYTPRGETPNARVNGRTTDNGSTSATGSVEDVTRTLGTDADKRTEAQTALKGVDIIANILDAMESIFDYAGGEYVY